MVELLLSLFAVLQLVLKHNWLPRDPTIMMEKLTLSRLSSQATCFVVCPGKEQQQHCSLHLLACSIFCCHISLAPPSQREKAMVEQLRQPSYCCQKKSLLPLGAVTCEFVSSAVQQQQHQLPTKLCYGMQQRHILCTLLGAGAAKVLALSPTTGAMQQMHRSSCHAEPVEKHYDSV